MVKPYTDVINDFIKRTNNFAVSGSRNDFLNKYSQKLISTNKHGNTLSNAYKLNTDISFQFEQEAGQHIIERFNIVFPYDNYIYVTWIKTLRENSEYECIDFNANVFITKMHPTPVPKLELKEKFEPLYEGPEEVHRQYAPRKIPTLLSVPKGGTRSYNHIGIGQLKIAIQQPQGNKMSIGITLSNVFNGIAEVRDSIGDSIKSLYQASGIDIKCKHYDQNLTITFGEFELLKNSDRYHHILNAKPYFEGGVQRFPGNYSYNEFRLAKEWKERMIAQFFTDCQSLHRGLIETCIDAGITTIKYAIGSYEMCTVKLI
ncbi:hypothetical protein ASG14_04695 [Pedobacter sp. Leaf194]|nr:hypothetical protein ASG14_04695 [Pedobacter sp. Leaf194]